MGTRLSKTRGEPAGRGDTHLGTSESGSMSSVEDLPSDVMETSAPWSACGLQLF